MKGFPVDEWQLLGKYEFVDSETAAQMEQVSLR